ncbi:hypothetical protein [Actinoplanes couchii]|uniref:Uncharacterized protein n=1 Tax=Actinoplanes couchii TaxID=403638 RepID=A0ABQ3XUD6_9ACTN|nr:hypothetical protein [Actinoplanes couchii]MDR6324534.1 hypothetical protein [Actinoplanes couchii]GID62040.1 hypothetical protein Aco03nite_104440 [Actinoplanes couchii]
MFEVSAIDRLSLGKHVCVMVNDDASRLRILAACIRPSPGDRHRILYSGGGAGDIEAQLVAHCIDARGFLANGQVQMAAPEGFLSGWRIVRCAHNGRREACHLNQARPTVTGGRPISSPAGLSVTRSKFVVVG